MATTEAQLDAALAEALFNNPDFAQWFLIRTRFKGESATCVFCRFDNPWGNLLMEIPDTASGEIKSKKMSGETDVLAVYETPDKRRLALHIENKLATGSFTHLQPELYRARLDQWKNKKNLGRYGDATSVLVAPKSFFDRRHSQAEIFEAFVSHEDIAAHLPLFAQVAKAGA